MKFFALVHRMRYVKRWGLMRNTTTENLQEHSFEVAVIAQALAMIRKEHGDGSRYCPSPEKVASAALFHDFAEIMTGDMPTPIKYDNDKIREAYAEIEQNAQSRLIGTLAPEFRAYYAGLMATGEYKTATGSEADLEAQAIAELVKAADRISAYIKCRDEALVGNLDFEVASKGILKRLAAMNLPEVDYWLKEIQPAYEDTLDEL